MLQADLQVQQQWYVNGQNYGRTLDAWLQRHSDSKAYIMRLLEVNSLSSAVCLQAEVIRHSTSQNVPVTCSVDFVVLTLVSLAVSLLC